MSSRLYSARGLIGLRLSAALALAALALLVASCDVPPMYPKVLGPPYPPTGSGSAEGSLEIIVPLAEFCFDSLDQPSPDSYGRLTSAPELGVFLDGFERPAATTDSQAAGVQNLGNGQWRLSFNLSSLAFGKYTLSEYYLITLDYGAPPSWDQVGHRLEFTLSEQQPEAAGLTLSFDEGGAADGGSFGGKLLISGNPSSATTIGVNLAFGEPGFASGYRPSWSVDYPGSDFGRLFYRCSQIRGKECYIGVDGQSQTAGATTRTRLNGQPFLSAGFILPAEGAAPQADLYLELRDSFFDQHEDVVAARHGEITCAITLTGATDWTGDLVLVAEDTSSAPAAVNSRAVAYLLPEDVGLGRKLSVKLGWLRPGTYQMDVYRLGERNSDPPARLGGASAPVAMPLPPLDYLEGAQGHRFYFQPEPSASVSFDLELQEGL